MSIGSKKLKEVYNDFLHVNNANDGLSATIKTMQTGKGNNTSLGLSTVQTLIKPKGADSTTAFEVQDKDGNSLLVVDSSNDRIKANGHDFNTQTKEFSLYDFSPTAGVHNPMVCNPVMASTSGDTMAEDTSAFGNGANPALTLDLSADGTPKVITACMWYVPYDIQVSEMRVVGTADGSQNIKFNLYYYTLDTSSNHGDLSSGVRIAYTSSLSATSSTIKTATGTLDNRAVSAGSVVFAFAEAETDTTDITCNVIMKYYLR